MENGRDLFEERMQVRGAMLAGQIPKRVPLYPEFTLEAACGLAGVDLTRAYYDMALVERAYRTVCDAFYSDTFPVGYFRYPSVYQILGSKNWLMSSNGTLQHPEVSLMEPEEYDEYCKDPYAFCTGKLFTRSCENLTGDPLAASLAFAKAYSNYSRVNGQNFGIMMEMSKEYGYGPGVISNPGNVVPFDFVADVLRGFEGALVDLRRRPDKVREAIEATYPFLLKAVRLNYKNPMGHVFLAFHMPAFINKRQAEELFWPTTRKLIEELDAEGIPTFILAEQDLTRYAEQFAALPKSTIISFEAGDVKHLKQTAGKSHAIGGFWDPTITLTRSKEACIDDVKRLLDICMPGGRFFFRYDRPVIDVNSIDTGKLAAVHDWLAANANY